MVREDLNSRRAAVEKKQTGGEEGLEGELKGAGISVGAMGTTGLEEGERGREGVHSRELVSA